MSDLTTEAQGCSVATLYEGGSSYGGGSPAYLSSWTSLERPELTMPLTVETADKVPLNIPEELLMTETTMSGGTSTGASVGGGISVCPSSESSLL